MFSLVESLSGKVNRQKAKNSVHQQWWRVCLSRFEKCLKKEGVRHELTVPKIPEQNGVAERVNRTLVKAVRSMLADSSLPHCFWAEERSTAVYLQNRSPTTAVEGKTLLEAWTGQKLNVGLLRVFGCAAYAHVAKDEHQKLDAKSRKCILLSYGTERKGYRLYDPRCERVFYSRDVVFDESSHGIKKEQSGEKGAVSGM